MGTMPFLCVYYKGHRIKRQSENHSAETARDCFEFVHQFLEIKWMNPFQTADSWDGNP